MSYLVRIRPEAERDVRDAVSWYEEQRPGLGSELILLQLPQGHQLLRRP